MAGVGVSPRDVRVAELKRRRVAHIEEVFPVTEISAARFGVVTGAKQDLVFSSESLEGKIGKPRSRQQIGNSQAGLLEPFIAEYSLVDQRPVDERELMGVQKIVFAESGVEF